MSKASEVLGMLEDGLPVSPNNPDIPGTPESEGLTDEEKGWVDEAQKMMEKDPSLKPPKKWFDKMVKKVGGEDPEAVVGHIWYHNLSPDKRKEIRGREGKEYAPANG